MSSYLFIYFIFYSIVLRCGDRGGRSTYAHFWAYTSTLSLHFARSLASLCQSIPFSSFISSHHRLGGLPLALFVSRGAQLIILPSHCSPPPLPYALQSSILTFLLSFLYLPPLFFSYLSICYFFVPPNSHHLSLHLPLSPL